MTPPAVRPDQVHRLLANWHAAMATGGSAGTHAVYEATVRNATPAEIDAFITARDGVA